MTGYLIVIYRINLHTSFKLRPLRQSILESTLISGSSVSPPPHYKVCSIFYCLESYFFPFHFPSFLLFYSHYYFPSCSKNLRTTFIFPITAQFSPLSHSLNPFPTPIQLFLRCLPLHHKTE